MKAIVYAWRTGETDSPTAVDAVTRSRAVAAFAADHAFEFIDLSNAGARSISDAEIYDYLQSMPVKRLIAGVCAVIDNVRCVDFGISWDQSQARSEADLQALAWRFGGRQATGFARDIVLGLPMVWPVFVLGETDTGLPLSWPFGIDAIGVIQQELATRWNPLNEAPGGGFVASEGAMARCALGIKRLHFLTPGDFKGANLKRRAPFTAFAEGYNALFDPTGLRTLIKAHQLSTVFRDAATTDQDTPLSPTPIRQIAERLRHAGVTIDEEPSVRDAVGYSLYRHGRRVWSIDSFETLEKGIWRADNMWTAAELSGSGLVLRDIQIQYSDAKREIPEPEHWDALKRKGFESGSSAWEVEDAWRRQAKWRAVSESERIDWPEDRGNKQFSPRLGIEQQVDKKNGLRGLLGTRKPLTSSLFVSAELEDDFGCWSGQPTKPADSPASYHTAINANRFKYDSAKSDHHAAFWRTSMLARLDLSELAHSKRHHHAAAPVNVAIANRLINLSLRMSDAIEPRAAVIGAVAAHEAYELLLGRSTGLAVEAYELLSKFEAMIETRFAIFPGEIDLVPRAQDIDLVLSSLLRAGSGNSLSNEDFYSAKIWNGLRSIYATSNHFTAAEAANLEVLINQPWLHVRSRVYRRSGFLRWLYSPKSWWKLSWPEAQPRLELVKRNSKPRRVLNRRIKPIIVRIRKKGYFIENFKRWLVPVFTDLERWFGAYIQNCLLFILLFFANWTIGETFSTRRLPRLDDSLNTLGQLVEFVFIGSLSDGVLRQSVSLSEKVEWAPWSILVYPFLLMNALFMGAIVAILFRKITRD